MKRIVLALLAWCALAAPTLAADAAAPAGAWRDVDPENVLVIDTNKGRIILELVPEVAPQSVARVKQLVRTRFYDGLSFFRVVDDFMDQTGDPKNTGQGGSSLPDLKGEFSFKLGAAGDMTVVAHAPGRDGGFIGALPVISQPAAMAALMADGKIKARSTFCPGVVGMARADAPDSANSQFFLMRGTKTELDGLYAAFGRVIVGEDVVRQIKTGEPVPDPQDRIQRIQVMADIPEGVRPTLKVLDTKSAYFAAVAAKAVAAEGQSFSLCDLDVPARVE
jgi:peptidylprolyl isomerase